MSDEILKGITALSDKLDEGKKESTKQITEVKSLAETKFADAEKLVKTLEENQKAAAEDINKKMAAQGKTVGEIAAELEEMKKKQGKYSAMGGPEAKTIGSMITDVMTENEKSIRDLHPGGRAVRLRPVRHHRRHERRPGAGQGLRSSGDRADRVRIIRLAVHRARAQRLIGAAEPGRRYRPRRGGSAGARAGAGAGAGASDVIRTSASRDRQRSAKRAGRQDGELQSHCPSRARAAPAVPRNRL